MNLKPGSVVLFQGDSITDCGRDRWVGAPNSPAAMGHGYAFLVASHLLMSHADSSLQVSNRGISGDTVPDLERRWEEDCLALKPDLLSILIGVNDFAQDLGGAAGFSVAEYESGLRRLLERTRSRIPDTLLVLGEPFVLLSGAIEAPMIPLFAQRRAVARRLASEFGAAWVPFQETFDQAVGDSAPAVDWAEDGVHPTMAGHALMAKAWLKALQ